MNLQGGAGKCAVIISVQQVLSSHTIILASLLSGDPEWRCSLSHGLYAPRLESHQGQHIFLFSAPVQTVPGAHPASCSMVPIFFPGVKRPERDVYHSPPSRAEVKSEWSYTSVFRIRLLPLLRHVIPCF